MFSLVKTMGMFINISLLNLIFLFFFIRTFTFAIGLKPNKYSPLINFQGHTECFNSELLIEEIKEHLTNLFLG